MAFLHKLANLLWVYVLCGVLCAGFGYQIFKHENPCPLCFLERLGMIGVAIGALMNLRFGIRVEHYGIALFSAFGGRIVSLRQIALHICPQFPTFGSPVFGYDLYVWAFIVFTCSVLVIAILLIVWGLAGEKATAPFWNIWSKIAFWWLALLIVANIVTVFSICGLSACSG
jgi:disulfide bond formation protein DsbB